MGAFLAHAILTKEVFMRRHSVNKHHSSRKFRRQVGRVKAANMRVPMRGGFRF